MAVMRWTDMMPTLHNWFPFDPIRITGFLPDMDVYGEGGDLMIKLDLPEFKAEDVDISLEDSVLTITGKHEHEEKVDQKDYYRHERRSGSFTRSLALPTEVKEEDIEASLKDGTLEVRVAGGAAVAAVEESKKIPIASS